MGKLTIEEAFEYVIWVKQNEGRSAHTLRDYQYHLKSCLQFLRKEGLKYVDEVNPLHLRRFLEEEKERGLDITSLNIRIRYIRACFHLLSNEGYIQKSPASVLKLFKDTDDQIRALSDDVVKLLLAQPDQRTFLGKRDYTLFLVMLDTGVRPSEVLKFQVDDFRGTYFTVRAAIAKDREERVLPVSAPTQQAVFSYLKVKRDWGGSLLFPNQEGKLFTTNGLGQALQKYCQKAGIKEKVRPYSFRHTFAVNYLKNGGKELYLKDILGHSSFVMTARYAKMTKDEFLAQHRAVNPVEFLFMSTRKRE